MPYTRLGPHFTARRHGMFSGGPITAGMQNPSLDVKAISRQSANISVPPAKVYLFIKKIKKEEPSQ